MRLIKSVDDSGGVPQATRDARLVVADRTRLLRRAVGVLLFVFIGGLALHLRVVDLLHRPLPAPAQVGSADQFYFAYGSNMPTRYLYNVRGVLPAESNPGFINDYEVSFLSSGLRVLEPAFSFLYRSEGKKAYGVLHRVSSEDLVKIKASEGALYQWRTLSVVLNHGQVVGAQTLVRLSPGEAGVPSERYLNLLIEGATEHGLPSAYIAQLRALPSAYVPVLSELTGAALQAVVMIRSGKCTWLLSC
ncbi:MAG: hypothetical protein COB04_05340 [Gammaproteobacteria bacterium]|nr:MAG: hypothetical protein COB04_05340 [Gammaproteobacteria bacterium]